MHEEARILYPEQVVCAIDSFPNSSVARSLVVTSSHD